MSVLVSRIHQAVLVHSIGPCQTYEGSSVALSSIDSPSSPTSKREACVSDRVHAFDNHVTCVGIQRHETSSNPGATRRPFPGFVIRAWVNLLPKSRSGRADGLGRKEANGRRESRGEGDCAAIVLGRDRVIVPLGLPRLLWEREGVYISSTPPISIPHHHPHPRPSFDKTFLANSHNS